MKIKFVWRNNFFFLVCFKIIVFLLFKIFDLMFCYIFDYCIGIECCVEILGLGLGLYLYLNLDLDKLEFSFGFENM